MKQPPMRWALVSSLALTSLTGCLAHRVDLNEKQVASLAITSPGNASICPGEQVPLLIVATLASGEKLETEGTAGGKVMWSSFFVETRGARFDPKGRVTADEDPRQTIAWPVQVRARLLRAPGPLAELDLPLTYACTYVANFNGSAGNDGRSGANESDSPGKDGGPGEAGWHGELVDVTVSLVPGPDAGTPLLSVFVRGARRERLYYIDPPHSSLLVRANGGDGGDGGSGGLGWWASNAANGAYGVGGNGGNGGGFIVHVSPAAARYMNCVHFENRGGHGGGGQRRGAEGRPGPPPLIQAAATP